MLRIVHSGHRWSLVTTTLERTMSMVIEVWSMMLVLPSSTKRCSLGIGETATEQGGSIRNLTPADFCVSNSS